MRDEWDNVEKFEKRYLEPFRPISYVFWPEKGFVVWRLGTGENIELLHIRTFVRGKGYARELVREMVRQLQENPPYFSIFGFAHSERTHLREVYQRLGFEISENIPGPYKGDPSFMFYQNYDVLKKRYLLDDESPPV